MPRNEMMPLSENCVKILITDIRLRQKNWLELKNFKKTFLLMPFEAFVGKYFSITPVTLIIIIQLLTFIHSYYIFWIFFVYGQRWTKMDEFWYIYYSVFKINILNIYKWSANSTFYNRNKTYLFIHSTIGPLYLQSYNSL